MKDKEIAPVVIGSEKFRAFIKDELFLKLTNDTEQRLKKYNWRICIRTFCNGNIIP